MRDKSGADNNIHNNEFCDTNHLERLIEGEKEAFWQIWQNYEPGLRNVCRYIMKNRPEEAEDALSTAMLRAFDTIFRDAHRIKQLNGWLRKLTQNVCLDVLRREKRLQPGLDESMVGEAVGKSNHSILPETYIIKEELLQSTITALNQLPLKLKIPLILRYLEQKPYSTIASTLRIKEANTRKRIQLAKDLLRKNLGCHEVHDLFQNSSEPFLLIALQHTKQNLPTDTHISEIEAVSCTSRLIRFFTGSEIRYVKIALPENIQPSLKKAAALVKNIKQNPRGWKRRLELAYTYQALGLWPEAIWQANQVITREPDHLETHILLARLYCGIGLKQPALRHIKRIYPINKTHIVEKYCNLIQQQLSDTGSINSGDAEEFDKIDANNIAYHQELLNSYHCQGRYNLAYQLAKKIYSFNSEDPIALTTLRSSMFHLGRYQYSAKYHKIIRQLYPDEPCSLAIEIHERCRKNLIFGEEGRHTRDLLHRLKKIAPETIVSLAAETALLCQHQKTGEAHEVFKRYLKSNRNDSLAWLYHGRLLYRSGARQEAITAIKRTTSINYSDLMRLPEAPQILIKSGKIELLEECLAAGITQYCQNAEIMSRMARVKFMLKHDSSQIEELSSSALNLDPCSFIQRLRHGQLLLHTRRREATGNLLEEAWLSTPSNSYTEEVIRGGLQLALLYCQRGNSRISNDYLQKTLIIARQMFAFFPKQSLLWQGIILRYRSNRFESQSKRNEARLLAKHYFDGTEADEVGVGVW